MVNIYFMNGKNYALKISNIILILEFIIIYIFMVFFLLQGRIT